MKKILSTVSMLLLVVSTVATAAPTVKRVETPDSVTKAVDMIYEFGRGESDVGGISEIRVYEISGGSPRDAEVILTAVLDNVKTTDAIAYACTGGEILNPVVSDVPACARLLLDSARAPRIVSFIDDLREMWSYADQVTDELESVKTYILRKVGHDRVEYSMTSNLQSVDVSASILFNETYTRAVVVFYDLGA